MHDSDPTISEDDFEVEFVDLDPQKGGAEPKQRGTQQPLHLSSRARGWLSALSLLAGVLLLLLVLSSILPASTPAKPSAHSATSAGSATVNISVVNGIAYVTSADGTVHALRASNGAPLWHYTPTLPASLTVINGVVYLSVQNIHGDVAIPDEQNPGQRNLRTQNNAGSFVEALRADTGVRLWRHTIPPDFDPLIVDGGVAYSLNEILSGSRTVAALSARDGALLWQYTLPTTPAAVFIQAVQDKVFVDAASGDNLSKAVLYIFRISDGSLLWHYQYTTNEVGFGVPVLDHNVLFIQGPDGSIKALSADTGALLWRYKPEKYALWGAFSQDGVVYTSVADGSIKALRADTGTLLWHYNSGEIVSYPPREIAGIVYIKTNVGAIDAVRASDGRRLWRYGVPSSFPFADLELAGAADGLTYMYARGTPDTSYSMIYALRTSDGALLWQRKTAYSNTLLDMQVQDGIVYLQEDNANFVVLRTRDGVMLWHDSFSAHTSPLPLVYRGMVYLISEDNSLDVRLGGNGALLWHFP